jgi:hypothetical protein
MGAILQYFDLSNFFEICKKSVLAKKATIKLTPLSGNKVDLIAPCIN